MPGHKVPHLPNAIVEKIARQGGVHARVLESTARHIVIPAILAVVIEVTWRKIGIVKLSG